MNIQYNLFSSDEENKSGFTRNDIADFLYKHLDQFGDSKEAILKCIAYAMGDNPGQSGQILVAHSNDKILGTVIINNTNMSGYIPEHMLVYIAVHGDARGKGVGKELMKRIIEATEGSIALHVEPDNPAKFLYEKFGFTNKYLEMRLNK